jgi:hypothetical protein
VPAAFEFQGIVFPDTPLNLTNLGIARDWRFLRVAAAHVPPGVSFTPTAADAGEESTLFLLSLGLLPDRRASSGSWWLLRSSWPVFAAASAMTRPSS